jgi:hypothetical protein
MRSKFIFIKGFTKGMEIIKAEIRSRGQGQDYGVIRPSIPIDYTLGIDLKTGATLTGLGLGHGCLPDQDQLSSK